MTKSKSSSQEVQLEEVKEVKQNNTIPTREIRVKDLLEWVSEHTIKEAAERTQISETILKSALKEYNTVTKQDLKFRRAGGRKKFKLIYE